MCYAGCIQQELQYQKRCPSASCRSHAKKYLTPEVTSHANSQLLKRCRGLAHSFSRAFRFYREKDSALSFFVDSRRNVPTHAIIGGVILRVKNAIRTLEHSKP